MEEIDERLINIIIQIVAFVSGGIVVKCSYDVKRLGVCVCFGHIRERLGRHVLGIGVFNQPIPNGKTVGNLVYKTLKCAFTA